jgi:Saxitoxin biosynthesis operon protein SxtJ
VKEEMTVEQLRTFGFIVGGIFAAIGVWPLIIRGTDPRWWALALAVCLIVPAAIFPMSLAWPHRAWMLIGHILGWINTRIILGVIFYLIVTPTGVIRHWLGKDPMGRRLRPDLDSYRVMRKPRAASHLKKQY